VHYGDARPLFSRRKLLDVLEERQADMICEIDQVSSDSLLEAASDKLAAAIAQKYALSPVKLRIQETSIDQTDEKVDVSQDGKRYIRDRSRPFLLDGTVVRFYVPFDGDSELFKYQPSTYSVAAPLGHVEHQDLVLTFATTDANADEVRKEFDREVTKIGQYLDWAGSDVETATKRLQSAAESRIAQRREKVLADHEMVTELGFPVRRANDAPETYVVPEIRRKALLTSSQPSRKATGAVLEPALSMEEYEHILTVVTNMVAVMERSPRAFAGMQEEDLRQHFLVQLNAQYEGSATGETFNFDGKTDILIRYKGKNLFIAECKFWEGPKALLETVDQLLGYTSWRDTRTAILLFNRTKNLSKVIEKIRETVEGHPNHVRPVEYHCETGFRFVLHHRDDTERELILTVLGFEVPQ